MNLLQTFMGCMYPATIRTESIESMDLDYPGCRFQVANVDEQGNEVSRGELQLTDRDIVYYRSSKFPTRWPLGYIRRYGCSDRGDIFLFEAGRRCSTGAAIFAFRLSRAMELASKVREKIEISPKNEAKQANFNPTTNNDQDQNDTEDNLMDGRSFRFSPRTFQAPNDPMANDDKKDAATSTENYSPEGPRPLSYALIDFDTTKALNESAQAHAARFK